MATIHGTSGDDEIFGTQQDDTVDAGAGNDLIWASSGFNTYLFGSGSGHDVLTYEGDAPNYRVDTIKLGPGITPANAVLTQNDDLGYVLSLNGGSDTLALDWLLYRDDGNRRAAQIQFDDGTLWADLSQHLTVRPGTPGFDRIFGSSRGDLISGLDGGDDLFGQNGDDTLLGGAGDDWLEGDSYAQSGNDVLDGGAGDDYLYGEIGSDTYRFGLGYGHDTIFDGQLESPNQEEPPYMYGGVDKVEFLSGVNPGDIQVTRSGKDAILTIAGTGDTLRIEEHFDYSPGWDLWFHKMDSFHFADGTVWTDLESHMAGGTPTPGDDVLIGTAGDDEIDGLGGNDHISGLGGNDHLIGSAGTDTLKGGDGADTLYGGYGNDVYDGGAGNDLMYSGGEDNTFLFGTGSGQDTIGYGGDAEPFGVDTIKLGPGLTPANVVLTQVSNYDYLLTINGSSDSVLLDEYAYRPDGPHTAQVLFDDGTLWTELEAHLTPAPATSGNDRIYGSSLDDALNGLAGNDGLFGNRGNDTLIGGAGNDTLVGDLVRDLGGNDVLDGGAGDDVLHGENGNDTYRFGLGYGHDTIFDAYLVTLSEGEQDYDDGGVDSVAFLAGVNPGDVRVTRDGDDAILTVVSSGETLTIENHFWTAWDGAGYYKVESFRFADGTVWTDLAPHLDGPTPGDDNLVGTSGADTINGLAGNDTISGLGGNDMLLGGAGNDVLRGVDGADTLDGGQDNDRLEGGGGNDVYRFGQFSGEDALRDSGGSSDRIEFGAGIAPADITVTRNGDDAYLTNEDTLDQLRIEDYFTSAGKIESIRFANGTSWTSLTSRVDKQTPTDGNNTIYGSAEDDSLKGEKGNDRLYGFSGDDTLKGNAGKDTLVGGRGDDFLEGGDGSDRLEGGSGSDTYYLKRGDGEDTIWEEYGQPGEPAETEGTDVALFASDIRANQLWFAKDGFNLEVTVIGTQTRFVIEDWYGAGGHIEKFVSGDGKELAAGNVNSLVEAMAAFSPPGAWQSNLPPNYAAALNPVIAANWQPAV